ncbi:hypothetical protein FRC20_001844 [Serendipita sp. 405]|nr:hypothetical protein FRC20_001844 [Serendipita sp. 405]
MPLVSSVETLVIKPVLAMSLVCNVYSTLLCCHNHDPEPDVQLVQQPGQQSSPPELPYELSITSHPVPSLSVTVHNNARAALGALRSWLQNEEEIANAILSYSEELAQPQDGRGSSPSGEANLPSYTFWLACWSISALDFSQDAKNAAPQLDVIAMICSNHLGPLPLLLFSPATSRFTKFRRDSDVFSDPPASSSLHSLVDRLMNLVPLDSIGSVVGPRRLVSLFTAVWVSRTSINRLHAPSKQFHLFKCLMNNSAPLSSNQSPPLATMSNAQGLERNVKRRSHESATSDVGGVHHARELAEYDIEEVVELLQLVDSFNLNQARIHAAHLLRNRLGWVLELTKGPELATRPGRIIAFCEVSRQTTGLAVVDRIFTRADSRRMGYAHVLLNHVLDWLSRRGKNAAVAHVPTNAPEPIRRLLQGLGFKQVPDTDTIQWEFENTVQTPW